MYKCEVMLQNEAGLHARPASRFVRTASKFRSRITVEKDNNQYDGKSIISVLRMSATKGQSIVIIGEGEDEEAAVAELRKLLCEDID